MPHIIDTSRRSRKSTITLPITVPVSFKYFSNSFKVMLFYAVIWNSLPIFSLLSVSHQPDS